MERNCEVCGKPIHPERLEALPDTTTCTEHSRAKRVLGFPVSEFSKGTAATVAFVNPEDKEQVRWAKRANGRRR